MSNQPDPYVLKSEEQKWIHEFNSKFLLCKDRAGFAELMRQLQNALPFDCWGAALAELEGEYSVTSNYTNINNFPDGLMEAYTSNAAEYFDVLVTHHFCERDFGALQRWQTTLEQTERQKDTMPAELYQKHLQWRQFLEEWGIMLDGYSIGKRTYFDNNDKWYGSIVNYADRLTFSSRTEEIIRSLLKAQHVALLKILKPELSPQ